MPDPTTLDSTRFTIQMPGDPANASINELRFGFRQGFVFELLDTRSPATEALKIFVFPINPRSYSITEPFATTLTPTEANTVVAEENGIILREIQIQGTFGHSDKRATGYVGAQGGGDAISGTAHFEELRSLFRTYSELKKDPNRSPFIKLIFHSMRDDDHWVVVPRSFETPRDAGATRIHYEYSIALTAIAFASTTTLRRMTDDMTAFEEFQNSLRVISESLQDARASYAEVINRVDTVRRRVGNIGTILTDVAKFINLTGAFASGVAKYIELPFDVAKATVESLAGGIDYLADSIVDSTAGQAGRILRSMKQMEAAFDRILMFDDKLRSVPRQITDLYRGERGFTAADITASQSVSSTSGGAGADIGSRTRAILGSDSRLSGLAMDFGTGIAEVLVSRTDTLESIATLAATRTELLIVINDLRFPYLSEGGGPGILAPGDTVLVPVFGADATVTSGTSYMDPEDALYGVDVAIDDTVLAKTGKFDIRVNMTRDRLDAELSKGLANVVQGTTITIYTEAGTTVFLPDIGMRRNVGVKGTLQHVLLASITLREAILSDPRISGIQSSKIVLDGDVLTQEISPIVTGRKSGMTLVLPFGSAAGAGA